MKNLAEIVKYDFVIPWCPENRLLWHRLILVLEQLSNTAESAYYFPGSVTS